MYLAIIILPLLGSIVSGFFGRKVGVLGSQIITSSTVITTTLLAIIAFIEVGLNNISVSVNLFKWIDSESLNIMWSFNFDSLTVSMLIPVLIVSSLVHLYSIGYMSNDPRRGCVRGNRNYGDKLSNSGDHLKLKIPSSSWKAISGWINHSGMVKSLKICENKMDNRGSKSDLKINSVKEQRVDGSWLVKKFAISNRSLRCTLVNFERNLKVKIPSKQYNFKNFSTYNSTYINPWVWSGLIDSKGSFTIVIYRNKTHKLGWRVKLKFQISLHIKDINLLRSLQQYLQGIGSINIARNRAIVNYSIYSIKHLNKLIIHLEEYPLLTHKAVDLFLFKQAIKLVDNKAHFTVEGLNHIVNIKASMNLGLSDMLKSEFSGYTPVERPVINPENVVLHPDWISGFTSAEGNFDVRMPPLPRSKTGYRVQLRFRITQHVINIKLMEKIVEYLGVAHKIYKYNGKSAVSLTIVDFSEITNVIIPFFNKHCIVGIKLYDYIDWCIIHKLMFNRDHLRVEGIDLIKLIKSGMNKSRN